MEENMLPEKMVKKIRKESWVSKYTCGRESKREEKKQVK
jgi:hypothetical protein